MLGVEALSLRVGTFALKEVSFEVKKGSYCVILGHTGSGKTLLLESIAGLHRIEGSVTLEGRDITSLPPEERRIGLVYQDFMLFPHMNVMQNIRFAKPYIGEREKSRDVDELLSLLQISPLADRDVQNLSGGEKQRVALARALYARPKVLLLDEPLSAVDPAMRDSIMALLKEIARRYDMTVVHVTHNFREAAFLAEEIIVLLDGSIVQSGSTDEVLTRPKTEKVSRFLGFKNILDAKVIGRGEGRISIDPNAITVMKHPPQTGDIHEAVLKEVGYAVDHYKIYLSYAGRTLFVKSPKSEFDALKIMPGERCYLQIDPKGVLFL